ncbi:MAG: PrsW family glutamic-type intramembrane protease [Candidatus Paceibacterota bacterium]|jgi:RsiW-degrading membrane proteinase PrsW (M82 family)
MATHHHINVKKTASIAIVASVMTWMAMRFPTYAAQATGALLGGILPALFWLWFWLREDQAHPEPKKIIFEAFVFGIIAVPFAIFFEKLTFLSFEKMTLLVFFTWAIIEEVFKYFAAFLAGIRTEYFDEPIDVVMYMISSALGFAAGENILFIYNSFTVANASMIPLRFIGASLLHVASSAIIGFGIGFGVGKKNSVRFAYLFTGLTIAFALHAAFNYFIMDTEGKSLMTIFALVWAVIVVIIVLFEKIKRSPYYLASIQ